MSNLLLVFMFLLFTIPNFLLGLGYAGLIFVIFGAVFGFEEFLANYYTGDTVSQHVWHLIIARKARGYKLLGFMLAGWVCWLASLALPGGPATVATIFAFLFLAIPSIIYKEYFLTLAALLFVLAVGFTNSLALQDTGMTVFGLMRSFASTHPWKFAGDLLAMLLGWLCLLAHLGIRFKK